MAGYMDGSLQVVAQYCKQEQEQSRNSAKLRSVDAVPLSTRSTKVMRTLSNSSDGSPSASAVVSEHR